MDLDASKKAQLIVFLYTLLNKPQPSFPAGYIAHMVYKGIPGTYVYMNDSWRKIG